MYYVLWTNTGSEEKTRQMIYEFADPALYSRCLKRHYLGSTNKLVKIILFPSYIFIETENIKEFVTNIKWFPGFNVVLHVDDLYCPLHKHGILDGYRKFYLQELRKVVDRIVCVISGTITPESREELGRYADDFFVRENKGLLTYSWIDGIEHVGWDQLEDYDELLMLNDSFFGPFFPLQELLTPSCGELHFSKSTNSEI